MFSEPVRTRYDLHCRLLGIPVRISPGFWLVAIVLGATARTTGPQLLLWVAAVLVSILVHEFGHALLMRRLGERPRVVLYHFGGLAIADDPAASWGYRPRQRSRGEQIAVSLAGPGAGFLLAALVVLLCAAGGEFEFAWRGAAYFVGLVDSVRGGPENAYLFSLILNLLAVNILWGLFNLVPVWPLDGGQVARAVLIGRPGGYRQSLRLSLGTAAALAAAFLLWRRGEGAPSALLFAGLAVQSYFLLKMEDGRAGFQRSYEPDERNW